MKRCQVFINEDFCKGCGICVHYCPREAILLSEEFNSKGVNIPIPARIEKCTGCRLCELYCPDFAIAIQEEDCPADFGPSGSGMGIGKRG